jgi:hypothetical protein
VQQSIKQRGGATLLLLQIKHPGVLKVLEQLEETSNQVGAGRVLL